MVEYMVVSDCVSVKFKLPYGLRYSKYYDSRNNLNLSVIDLAKKTLNFLL